MTRLLALVLPALVLLGVGHILTQPLPWEPSPKAQALDELAKKGPYDVVVVGPSIAGSDIHPALLGRQLGPDYRRVLVLAHEGSTAPTWYAMLKDRAYKNGLRPKVVVISGVLNGLLTTWIAPSQRAAILAHLPEPDAVLLRKTWGSSRSPTMDRALEHRASLRAPVLSFFRLLLPSLALPNAGSRTDEAGMAVFGDRHTLVDRLLPGVEEQAAFEPTSWMKLEPGDSLIPDIAALVRDHGGIPLVALPPIRASQKQYHQLSPEGERRLVQFLNAQGVGLVDLRHASFSDAMFRDGLHMNQQGQQRFTTMLAEQMIGLGLKEGRFDPVIEPIEPRVVERVGSPPDLEVTRLLPGKLPCSQVMAVPTLLGLSQRSLWARGNALVAPLQVLQDQTVLQRQDARVPQDVDCKGNYMVLEGQISASGARPQGEMTLAWDPAVPILNYWGTRQYWVLPSTALRWSFDRRWGTNDAYRVEVSAIRQGEGGGHLRVGSTIVPLEAVVDRWEAAVEVDPAEQWDIEIQADPGTYLVVRRLALTHGSQQMVLVKEERPAAVALLGAGYQVEGGSLELPTQILSDAPESHQQIHAPFRNELGCSPLRVLADGVAVARPAKDFYTLPFPRDEGATHLGDRLWFHDESATVLQLAYDPDRLCWSLAGQLWLYPGDKIVQDVTTTLRRTRSAIQRLDLRVRSNSLPPEGSRLSLSLLVDGRLHLRRELELRDVEELEAIAVEPPLPPQVPVQVEIQTTSGTPPLLIGLTGQEG